MAPPPVDLATVVSVFWVSAAKVMAPAMTFAPPLMAASVALSWAAPITATPSEMPLPPTVVEPSAIAAAMAMLVADSVKAPPTVRLAPLPTCAFASLVRNRPAIEASAVSAAPGLAALIALALTSDVALTSSLPVVVIDAPTPPITTSAEPTT